MTAHAFGVAILMIAGLSSVAAAQSGTAASPPGATQDLVCPPIMARPEFLEYERRVIVEELNSTPSLLFGKISRNQTICSPGSQILLNADPACSQVLTTFIDECSITQSHRPICEG